MDKDQRIRALREENQILKTVLKETEGEKQALVKILDQMRRRIRNEREKKN